MRDVPAGFIIGLILVLCAGYAKAGFAMEFTRVENLNCGSETDYHDRTCNERSELVELKYPDAWGDSRRNREKRVRWYGVKGKVSMIRMVLEGVQFDFDKSELRPDAIPIMERNVAKLAGIPYNVINVIGYTDSKGTKEYNQTLSEERAKAVKDYLVKRGIASNRIMVLGRGESGEVAPNFTPSGKDNPAGRAENRRAIELQIWTN